MHVWRSLRRCARRSPRTGVLIVRQLFGLVPLVILSTFVVQAVDSVDDGPAAWEFTDGGITFVCVGPDGTPVANAQVDFVEWDYFVPPLTGEVRHARTDDEGTCTFAGLTGTMSHGVHATKDERGCWLVKRFLRPSDKHPTVTLTLDVYRQVCGVVQDKSGAPISGVQLLNRAVFPGAVTDERGGFCISNLQSQQEFSFYKPGYGWMNSGLSGPVAVLEITLPEGGLLDVTVFDESGEPVPGAKVNYSGGNQYYGGGASATQVTDAQGKVTTVWLPGDRAVPVSASYERDGYLWRSQVEVRPPPGKTTPITLRPTVQSKIVKDGGKRYISLKERPRGVVTGKVVMEGSGEPVVASILYDTSHEWVRSVRAATLEDGTFRCDGLELETYYFTAFPRSAALYNKGGLVRVDLSEAQPSRELTFTIAEGCVSSRGCEECRRSSGTGHADWVLAGKSEPLLPGGHERDGAFLHPPSCVSGMHVYVECSRRTRKIGEGGSRASRSRQDFRAAADYAGRRLSRTGHSRSIAWTG